MLAPKTELQNKLGTVVIIEDPKMSEETVRLITDITTKVETTVHLVGQESDSRTATAVKEARAKKEAELNALKTEAGKIASRILRSSDHDIKKLESDAEEIFIKLRENNKQKAAIATSEVAEAKKLDAAFKILDDSRKSLAKKIDAIKAIPELQKEHSELTLSIESKDKELSSEVQEEFVGRDEAEFAALVANISKFSKNVKADDTFGIDKETKGNHIIVVKTAAEVERVSRECAGKFFIEGVNSSIAKGSEEKSDDLSLSIVFKKYQQTFEGEKKIEAPEPEAVNDNEKTTIVDRIMKNAISQGEVVKSGKLFDLLTSVNREIAGRSESCHGFRGVLVQGAALTGSPLLSVFPRGTEKMAGTSYLNLDLYNAKPGVNPVHYFLFPALKIQDTILPGSIVMVVDEAFEKWAGSKSYWTQLVGTFSGHAIHVSK